MAAIVRFAVALAFVVASLSGCADEDPVFPLADAGSDATSAVCSAGATQLCACAGGDTGAQVCEADGSAWAACDCASAPNVDGVSIAVTDADDADAVGIVAMHVVGTTDCLQPLGTISLTNAGEGATTVSYASAQPLPQIVFEPAGEVTVEPGASASVQMVFNCELLPAFPPENIATSVTVASGETNITFPLQLTFSGL